MYGLLFSSKNTALQLIIKINLIFPFFFFFEFINRSMYICSRDYCL